LATPDGDLVLIIETDDVPLEADLNEEYEKSGFLAQGVYKIWEEAPHVFL
jgi:hypothetical protein